MLGMYFKRITSYPISTLSINHVMMTSLMDGEVKKLSNITLAIPTISFEGGAVWSQTCNLLTYSLFHISINPQSKSFYFSATTQNIETCNIPLKSPIKWLPKMQKIFLNFQLLLGFRGHFRKSSVFEKWVR